MRWLSRQAACGDAGVELVEMAFILPVLLSLLIGVVWIGRAYNISQTLNRAAREGARLAVLTNCASCGNTSYTSTEIQTNFINPALSAANLDPGQVQSYSQTFTWLDPSDSPPQQCGIVINFQYPFALVIPFTSVNATTVTISTNVQMRLENQPAGGTCP